MTNRKKVLGFVFAFVLIAISWAMAWKVDYFTDIATPPLKFLAVWFASASTVFGTLGAVVLMFYLSFSLTPATKERTSKYGLSEREWII